MTHYSSTITSSISPVNYTAYQRFPDKPTKTTPYIVVGSKATATFTSAAGGKEETLVMKGNWRDSTADIVDETRNAVVARISRKSTFKSFTTFATGQNQYGLTVAPGVDYALMAALCVCFDEFNNESSASA